MTDAVGSPSMQTADDIPSGSARVGVRVLAWALLIVSTAFSLIAVALVLTNAARPSKGATIVAALAALSFPVVGLLIARAQPKNPIGWLFLVAGLAVTWGGLIEEILQSATKTGTEASRGVLLVYALASGWWAVGLGCLLVLSVLLFPDGHLLSKRWRVAVWIEGLSMALIAINGPMTADTTSPHPNPLLVEGVPSVLNGLGAILFVAMIPVAATALILRFRRSRGAERDQMKWFVYGTAFTLTAVLVGIAFDATGHPDVRANILGFAIMAIPITAGIAILRYKLWDIDVVIRKTIVYVVLAALILIVALVAIVAVGGIVVGPLRDNAGALVFTGLAIGVAIWPLRRFATRIADRLVFGRRATPYEVLTAFAGRIGETYATDDVLPRMAAVLASGTGAISASVLLRVGGDLKEAATHGEPGAYDFVEPVIQQGEDLGALAVRMPANDPMSPSKQKLVEDLATQAGPVLNNVKLIEELKASRQRLVAAQDEERRKIERNIHDGAQQQLVALAVQLRLAGQMVGKDPDRERELLSSLAERTSEALEDLRDLARGIYPPLLQDKGLPAALEAQARKSVVPTVVHADGIGRFDQDTESAVYFSCLEAMQNIAKYAEATNATIALANGEGSLRFAVTDDGQGFDTNVTSYGTGLQGIADRLAAIGGELTVASTPGQGTTITGTVPT